MKKYILILFTAISFGQASNQMVSFTAAQSLGFALNSGQSHITSNQCMTKTEALAKYNLDASAMGSYASNQLVPRSAWVSGIVGLSLQLIETTSQAWGDVCSVSWTNPITKYTKTGLKQWNQIWSANLDNGIYAIYNDIGCTSKLQIAGKTYKALENGVYKRLAGESHMDDIAILEDCSAPVIFYTHTMTKGTIICSGGSLAFTSAGTLTLYSNVSTVEVGTVLYTNTSLTTPTTELQLKENTFLYDLSNGAVDLISPLGDGC